MAERIERRRVTDFAAHVMGWARPIGWNDNGVLRPMFFLFGATVSGISPVWRRIAPNCPILRQFSPINEDKFSYPSPWRS